MQQARQAWRESLPERDIERLVFVDETWASTSLTRLYGRSPRGERCIAAAPYGNWQTTTFVAGLRSDGLTAPMVLDGAIDGESFLAWVEQFLCPTLREGDIVILDNLGSHKVEGVRTAIESRGASVRYLPPYSPDFNPIEKLFSKLKSLLRKAAKRTTETLWQQIGELLDGISPTECKNYFASAGYVSI